MKEKENEQYLVLSSLPKEWQTVLSSLDVQKSGKIKYSDFILMIQQQNRRALWSKLRTFLLFSFLLVFCLFQLNDNFVYFNTKTVNGRYNNHLFKSYQSNELVYSSSKGKTLSYSKVQKEEIATCTGSGVVAPYVCLQSQIVAVFALQTSLSLTLNSIPDSVITILISGASPYFEIPVTINRFHSLQWLALSESLSGTIPSEFGQLSQLELLLIGRSIELNPPLPSEFGLLSSLASIDFSFSSHPGTLPSELGLLPSLSRIFFQSNSFSGTIPSWYGELSHAQFINFESNKLSGTVPSKLFDRQSLLFLGLSYNLFEGTFPNEVGYLDNLSSLQASHNRFSGQIPGSLFSQSSLVKLSLESNKFSGALLFKNITNSNLEQLDLENNELSGTIPTQIGCITKLTYLNFGFNQFSGSLPSQIGLLTNLQYLILSRNQFTGRLPNELSQLTKLIQLSISHNQFVGQLVEFPPTINITIECIQSGLDDTKCPKGTFISDVAYYIMVAFVCVGLVLQIVVLVLLRMNSNTSLIRSTNPYFSYSTIAGLVCLLGATIPFGYTLINRPKLNRDICCRASMIMTVLGVVFVFGSISARNYPIWQIFDNPTLREIKLPPAKLARPIFWSLLAAICLDIPLLIDYQAVDDYYGCATKNSLSPVFITTLGVLFFLLAAFAFYTCFKIRNVPSRFNDTKNIARATYNLLTFGLAMVILGFATQDPLPLFISVTLAIFLGTLTFVWSVHLPKLRKIYGSNKNSIEF
eukprot:c18439_g2_i3.p1 GENE.c18439_g2_i3~~c18439_g2_i3.p1  ORF type:complete len:769 (+),score=176.60 c18439_g2_i3:49-2307(+)